MLDNALAKFPTQDIMSSLLDHLHKYLYFINKNNFIFIKNMLINLCQFRLLVRLVQIRQFLGEILLAQIATQGKFIALNCINFN